MVAHFIGEQILYPGCREGKEQKVKRVCVSLHRRRSFLTLNDLWLKVYSDVNKRNVCRGHAEKNPSVI